MISKELFQQLLYISNLVVDTFLLDLVVSEKVDFITEGKNSLLASKTLDEYGSILDIKLLMDIIDSSTNPSDAVNHLNACGLYHLNRSAALTASTSRRYQDLNFCKDLIVYATKDVSNFTNDPLIQLLANSQGLGFYEAQKLLQITQKTPSS